MTPYFLDARTSTRHTHKTPSCVGGGGGYQVAISNAKHKKEYLLTWCVTYFHFLKRFIFLVNVQHVIINVCFSLPQFSC